MTTSHGKAPRLGARFRFHDELGQFIARPNREREFTCACPPDATVKHMVEALGVPHTEVGLVLVDGKSAGMTQRLHEGAQVEVYPHSRPQDCAPGESGPDDMQLRFVADAHLGGLARLLRMAGFDTLYDSGFQDDEIVLLSGAGERIVLTRDTDLLKRRDVELGCHVRSLKPDQQLGEVAKRFPLAQQARPFSRCLVCNVELVEVERQAVEKQVPPGVWARHRRFKSCPSCGRVYWGGTHWERMRLRLGGLIAIDDLQHEGR